MAPILKFPSFEMRATFSFDSYGKTALLILVAACSFGTSSSVSATGATLHIEQRSGSASYGEWTLLIPGGSNYTSTLRTKVLTGLATGTYRLTVRPLSGVTSNIKLYNNNILLEETSAASLTFDLKDGDMFRATIEYSRNGTVEVRSDRNPDVVYEVDAEAGTCTCPHYIQKLRLVNEAEGKALFCKHVAKARNQEGNK